MAATSATTASLSPDAETMLDDESIVLDLDENNHPVRYQGRDKVIQYFRSLEQGAKAQGLKFKTTIAKNDCSATATMGYCVVEFDQTITAGGQSMGPFKLRATLISRKVGDDWRWTHWHGSFREIPGPPSTSTTSTTSATTK
jgi:ketosteroid isomerase-like protein